MPSELKGRLQADLNTARKARDKVRTLVLSTVLADLRNKEIETGGELDDAAVLQVLTKAIKQRKDAAGQMRDAGREELAVAEEAQVKLLEVYMPEGLDEEEVRAIVLKIVAGGTVQMGAVMGQLMPQIRGRFDGKEANRIAREVLAAHGDGA